MEGQGNNQVLSHSHAAINTADIMHSVDIGYIQCVVILGQMLQFHDWLPAWRMQAAYSRGVNSELRNLSALLRKTCMTEYLLSFWKMGYYRIAEW